MDDETTDTTGTGTTGHTGDGADGDLLDGLPPGLREAIRPRRAAPPPDAPRGGLHHIGPRPPSYPPRPRGLPSARGGDLLAAVLPDTVLDGAEYGPLTVRAASVRGDSHRWQGECRQDALCVTRLGTSGVPGTSGADGADGADGQGLLLLAVADGVGSAPRSHRGSHAAVCLAAEHLDPVAGDLEAALRAQDAATFSGLVNKAVADAAGELRVLLGVPGAEYATTLRALLVPLDPHVAVRGFLAVGDGGLFRLRGEGWWDIGHPAVTPDGSGVIDTGTAALPDAYQRVVTWLLDPAEPGDVLVLCTDGFSGPLAGEARLRAFLAEQWGGTAPVPQPSDFLWQLQARVKSYDDDRTVVCLWEGVR